MKGLVRGCQIQACGWHVSVEVGFEVPGRRLLWPKWGSSDTAAALVYHCCRPSRLSHGFVWVESHIVQHRHDQHVRIRDGRLIRCNAGGPQGAAPRLSPCCRGRPQRANFQAEVPYPSTGGIASTSWPRTTRVEASGHRNADFLEGDALRAAAEDYLA